MALIYEHKCGAAGEQSDDPALFFFFFFYPVAVEELDGSEDVKLACHQKLDGQLPGQRGHPVLTGPLVDFLQKLPGSLKQTRIWSQTLIPSSNNNTP